MATRPLMLTVKNNVQGRNGGINATEQNTELSIESIMPNPASDITTIRFNLKSSGNVQVYIRDVSGKLIQSFSYDGVAGTNEMSLNNFEKYPNGVLLYTLRTPTNSSITGKIVKQ